MSPLWRSQIPPDCPTSRPSAASMPSGCSCRPPGARSVIRIDRGERGDSGGNLRPPGGDSAGDRTRRQPAAAPVAREPAGAVDSRLATLTGGARDLPVRQRTLRDTIAWSYDLLSDEEQTVFRRLAVFTGGCALDLAVPIVVSPTNGTTRGLENRRRAAPDTAAALADKSLLRWLDVSGGNRMGMLEIVREYGVDALVQAGEDDAIRRAHAQAFLALAERAAPELMGPEQPIWLDRVELEHDNFRSALRWALAAGESSLAIKLVGCAVALLVPPRAPHRRVGLVDPGPGGRQRGAVARSGAGIARRRLDRRDARAAR